MTATLPAPSKRRSPLRTAARAVAFAVAAAAITVAGVLIAGGVITNDFRLSMALTAAWFVAAGTASVASFKAGRSTGVPIVAGYLVAATAIGGYLALTTLKDKVVDEAVVTGTPASEMPTTAARREPRNVEESRGTFTSAEHATTGTARVIRLASGRRVLTLTNFSTSPGPDLGALKGNRGDQQYDVPDGVRPRNHTVRIWCRAFSALFGSAQLREA